VQTYIQTVGRIIRILCVVFGVATVTMLGFTTVDCTASMGWGWDCGSAWIGLVILVMCAIVYFGSKAIQRIVSGVTG
jgi:hypothetical protein